ncbi:MAG: metallophosphoesterase [Methanocorpusculum sp.]|nr:metallophosphoesterase [Methanocorpusculum sp.]
MTDIIFITDIHGKTDIASSIFEKEDPDYVLIGGDITDLGQSLEKVIPLMADIAAPTFAVPGNCDSRGIISVIEASDAVSIHNKTIDIGDITLTGIGGSNKTPFDTPFEYTEEEIDEMLSPLVSKMKKNRWNILVSHAPPYGALDEVALDVRVGSHSVAEYIKNFDIVCCGHIHEQKGIAELEGRICVNPGMCKEGNYAVITLEEDEDPKIVLKNINDEE